MDDRYGSDVLAAGLARRSAPAQLPRVEAARDLVVEVADDGFCGAVVGVASGTVELEDRHGSPAHVPARARIPHRRRGCRPRRRRPLPAARAAPRRTASGSFAAEDARARTARASRIFVEGRHDAELVEKVWGDDLRAEGVVVEYLQGIDLLEAVLDERAAVGRAPLRRARRPPRARAPRSRASRTPSPAAATARTCGSSATRGSTSGSA